MLFIRKRAAIAGATLPGYVALVSLVALIAVIAVRSYGVGRGQDFCEIAGHTAVSEDGLYVHLTYIETGGTWCCAETVGSWTYCH